MGSLSVVVPLLIVTVVARGVYGARDTAADKRLCLLESVDLDHVWTQTLLPPLDFQDALRLHPFQDGVRSDDLLPSLVRMRHYLLDRWVGDPRLAFVVLLYDHLLADLHRQVSSSRSSLKLVKRCLAGAHSSAAVVRAQVRGLFDSATTAQLCRLYDRVRNALCSRRPSLHFQYDDRERVEHSSAAVVRAQVRGLFDSATTAQLCRLYDRVRNALCSRQPSLHFQYDDRERVEHVLQRFVDADSFRGLVQHLQACSEHMGRSDQDSDSYYRLRPRDPPLFDYTVGNRWSLDVLEPELIAKFVAAGRQDEFRHEDGLLGLITEHHFRPYLIHVLYEVEMTDDNLAQTLPLFRTFWDDDDLFVFLRDLRRLADDRSRTKLADFLAFPSVRDALYDVLPNVAACITSMERYNYLHELGFPFLDDLFDRSHGNLLLSAALRGKDFALLRFYLGHTESGLRQRYPNVEFDLKRCLRDPRTLSGTFKWADIPSLFNVHDDILDLLMGNVESVFWREGARRILAHLRQESRLSICDDFGWDQYLGDLLRSGIPHFREYFPDQPNILRFRYCFISNMNLIDRPARQRLYWCDYNWLHSARDWPSDLYLIDKWWENCHDSLALIEHFAIAIGANKEFFRHWVPRLGSRFI